MGRADIYVFGSSSAYGSGDPEGGWVSHLRRTLDPMSLENGVAKSVIYNLGVSGETSDGLRKRFSNELEARLKAKKQAIIIFAIGGNDAAFMPSVGRFRVEADRFAENLASLVMEAKTAGRVIVQSLTPVNDTVTEYRPTRDRSKANRHVEAYNLKLKAICQGLTVPVVDAYSAFMQHDHRVLLSVDGVHPNAQGHRLLAELMLASLQETRAQ